VVLIKGNTAIVKIIVTGFSNLEKIKWEKVFLFQNVNIFSKLKYENRFANIVSILHRFDENKFLHRSRKTLYSN